MTGSLEFVTLRVVHNEPPAIHHLQFGFLTLTLVSPWFLLVRLCSGKLAAFICLCSSAFPILRSVVCPMSFPLLVIQEELFSFQSISFLLVKTIGDFQTPYMWNWTLGVPSLWFIMILWALKNAHCI